MENSKLIEPYSKLPIYRQSGNLSDLPTDSLKEIINCCSFDTYRNFRATCSQLYFDKNLIEGQDELSKELFRADKLQKTSIFPIEQELKAMRLVWVGLQLPIIVGVAGCIIALTFLLQWVSNNEDDVILHLSLACFSAAIAAIFICGPGVEYNALMRRVLEGPDLTVENLTRHSLLGQGRFSVNYQNLDNDMVISM